MKKPRVSVGMPVYNREKFLPVAIEAQLNQTNGDFELIITDNASTDHTEEICRDYAARDSRIRYYRNERNLGAAGNYRCCFELAEGEYYRWTPSDDFVSPNLHERAIEVLDSDPSVLVAYGRTKLIDGEGRVIADFDENLHLMDDLPSSRWKRVFYNMRLGNIPYGLTRTAQLRRTGLIRNYTGGDIPFVAEMSLYGKFYEIPDAYFYRRMHEEAGSALKNPEEIMRVYNPARQAGFFAREWVHLGANLLSVARAPIPLTEKLRIYGFEMRRALWHREALVSELGGVARRLTGLS